MLSAPRRGQVKRKTLTMNVRTEIVTQFKRVAQEQGKRLAPLTDGLELLNSGLDSLSMAILVSRLEDSLGIDPFTASEDAQFPVTFGDFVNLYEHVAK
jgi:aryl carrier-like protein